MATPRDIRRLALQAVYQLDARDGDHEAVRASVESSTEEVAAKFSAADVDKAMELAERTFESRTEADAMVRELAPTWPAERQPAIDRAILRLAHYEMASGLTPPKVVVNEAIELAKQFGTERSPAFINGVLDKILKRIVQTPEQPQPAPIAETDD